MFLYAYWKKECMYKWFDAIHGFRNSQSWNNVFLVTKTGTVIIHSLATFYHLLLEPIF